MEIWHTKEKSGNWSKQLKETPKKKDISKSFGKSDRITEIHRLYAQQMLPKGNFDEVICHVTSAVFHAASPIQKERFVQFKHA